MYMYIQTFIKKEKHTQEKVDNHSYRFHEIISSFKCKSNREIIHNQAKISDICIYINYKLINNYQVKISDIYINYKLINNQTFIKKGKHTQVKADNHCYQFHEIFSSFIL